MHVRAYQRGGIYDRVAVTAFARSAPSGGSGFSTRSAGSKVRAYLLPVNVANAEKKMQDYLTFFRQNAERDRRRGEDNGWELAISHLEHFLDGSGTTVVLTSEQVSQMPALVNAEQRGREKFGNTFTATTNNTELNSTLLNLADGQSIKITDFWNSTTSLLDNRSGDYAAIGRSSVYSLGTFRATRNANRINIEGEAVHRLGTLSKDQRTPADAYDFEAGQPGSFPAITLEDAGKAKRFDMTSEPRRQNVSAQVKIRSDGRLELTGLPNWGAIRSP